MNKLKDKFDETKVRTSRFGNKYEGVLIFVTILLLLLSALIFFNLSQKGKRIDELEKQQDSLTTQLVEYQDSTDRRFEKTYKVLEENDILIAKVDSLMKNSNKSNLVYPKFTKFAIFNGKKIKYTDLRILSKYLNDNNYYVYSKLSSGTEKLFYNSIALRGNARYIVTADDFKKLN